MYHGIRCHRMLLRLKCTWSQKALKQVLHNTATSPACRGRIRAEHPRTPCWRFRFSLRHALGSQRLPARLHGRAGLVVLGELETCKVFLQYFC